MEIYASCVDLVTQISEKLVKLEHLTLSPNTVQPPLTLSSLQSCCNMLMGEGVVKHSLLYHAVIQDCSPDHKVHLCWYTPPSHLHPPND